MDALTMMLQAGAAQSGGGGLPVLTVPHAPLPPFDPDDEFGQVHTVLPPEQVIPPRFTDPLFMRADFNGVTLDLQRWKAQTLPFLAGANSTPLAMLMTPMLALYPRYWQDACLTEHAERGYDDFVISASPWNEIENGQWFAPADMVAWCRYVKSWGFRVVLWRGGRPPDAPDERLQMLCDAGVVNFYIHGKEVDSQYAEHEQFEESLAKVDAYLGGRIPIGVHFTANAERRMGYPIGAPREYFLDDWSPWNGRVHLMQQLDVDAPAGLQGASMYYGRERVNISRGHGGTGTGAPDSRVIAFETKATAQLYGRCTEEQGCLASWQLLCGTRNDPRVRPVSGSGNGLRAPGGEPV